MEFGRNFYRICDSPGYQCIPLTKGQYSDLWCFFSQSKLMDRQWSDWWFAMPCRSGNVAVVIGYIENLNLAIIMSESNYRYVWPSLGTRLNNFVRFSLAIHNSENIFADYETLFDWQIPTIYPLQWRHNYHDGISNHRRLDCLFNLLFGRRSKKTSTLSVIGLCEGNPPATSGFPSQRASNAISNGSISHMWHPWSGSSDIQVMACCLVTSTKSNSLSMAPAMKFDSKYVFEKKLTAK